MQKGNNSFLHNLILVLGNEGRNMDQNSQIIFMCAPCLTNSHSHVHTYGQFKSANSTPSTSLECGRKLKYLEKIHTCTGTTCKPARPQGIRTWKPLAPGQERTSAVAANCFKSKKIQVRKDVLTESFNLSGIHTFLGDF